MMLSGFKSRCIIPNSSCKYCSPYRIYLIIVLISVFSSNLTNPFLLFFFMYSVRLMSIFSNIRYNLRFSYSILSAFRTNGQWSGLSLNFCKIYISHYSNAFFLLLYLFLNLFIAYCFPLLQCFPSKTCPKLPEPIISPNSNSPHKMLMPFAGG